MRGCRIARDQKEIWSARMAGGVLFKKACDAV